MRQLYNEDRANLMALVYKTVTLVELVTSQLCALFDSDVTLIQFKRNRPKRDAD